MAAEIRHIHKMCNEIGESTSERLAFIEPANNQYYIVHDTLCTHQNSKIVRGNILLFSSSWNRIHF